MTQVLTKEFIKRLVNDVKYLKKNPLHSNGIHYIHDDEDMMTGYALIIGPENTVYEKGYYFFKFTFTSDYPHKPPQVKYITNGGNVRFNPNLYTDGKVCISLLNTWTGEQWTSCQSISTILLTLCTLLNENPLLTQPNVYEQHKDIPNYNKIIEYSNYDIAICDVIDETSHLHNEDTHFIKLFRNVYIEHFKEHYPFHLNKIEKWMDSYKTQIISYRVSIYNMTVNANYKKLLKKIEQTYTSISEEGL